MNITNGDLDAACNPEDHITKIMAVRFLYDSIKKIVLLTTDIIRKA